MPTPAQLGRAENLGRTLLKARSGRAIALAVFLGFWAFSPATWALGLGPLKVESSLGSPLRASVPVRLDEVDSAGGVEVALGSVSDYEMVGKPRPAVLNNLEVRLEDGRDPVARLSSTRPVDSPLFEVLIRVSSDGNRVLKMYTVTLDPPQVSEPDSRTTSPPPSSSATQKNARSGADRPRIRTEQLPTEGDGQPPNSETARPAVERPDVEVSEGWAKRDRYGPVRQGDTLATIVERLRQDPSISLESALVATWKANSKAFIDGNMNLLKQGAVLEVPSASQVRDYRQAEAEDIIRRQRKDWQERGQPGLEKSPGHERYQLKVSVQDPDGDPADASKGAASDNAEGQVDAGGASDGESESQEANNGAQSGQEGEANPGPETAEGQAGEEKDSSGKEAAAPADGESDATAGNAAMVAELRTRITELQETLENQQMDREATVTALEKRMDGLQSDLEKQEKLVAQKNIAMERLADQGSGGGSGMPPRESYILWLVAGVNLLMLLAILALWMRLRAVQKGVGPAPHPGGGEEGAAPDSLSQADAQAAAGEIKQARSTLWQALASNPRNWAAYGRLLDLYEQDEDADQFEEVAQRLFEQLGDQQPDWQEEIRNRGRRLMPESSLFAGIAGGSQAAQSETAAPSFDFDGLDLQGTASEAEEAGGERSAAPTVPDSSSGSEEEVDLTFDLGEEEGQLSPAPTETDGAAEGTEDSDVDLDLGLDEEESEPAGPAASEVPNRGDDEVDLDLILDDKESDPSPAPGGAGQESAGTEDSDLEFDLGLDEDEPVPAEPAVSEEATGGDDEEELDLSLDDEESGSSSSASGKTGQEAGGSEGSDLEFDLGLDEDESGSLAPQPGNGQAGVAARDDESDLDLDLGEDAAPAVEASPDSGSTPADESGGEDLVLTGGEEASLHVGGSEEGAAAGGADVDLGLTAEGAEEGQGGTVEEAGLEGLDPSGGSDSSASGPSDSPGSGSSAGGAQADDDLGLDLSGGEDEEEQPFGGLEGEGSSDGSASEEGAAGLGSADDDELEIKLDLAQAWIEMGDQDSARGLLEEVGNRGDADQQGRARQILKTLT